MARVRFAASAALVLLLLLGSSARGPSPAAPWLEARPAAVVGWPVSSGLVVAEVVTGGASASDEYVELYNASEAPVDLAGLEVAYVTSSGATVTRKTAWTGSLPVEPGRHVLLANALGAYAAIADATWSGGFAATGGSVVLRPIGGTPIDAVGWGDAVNAFVEGVPAPAPAAGRSIERLPGGPAGNGVDTNDNAADLSVNAAPVPQGLASDPFPGPSPTPGVTPIASPSPVPTPVITPSPTVMPTPTPTESTEPTPEPTPAPTPTPTPAPTPEPTPEPTMSPSPTLDPVLAIQSARALADGAIATVEGVLTTGLGVLDDGLTGFVQDETAGIAVYLQARMAVPLPAGTVVQVRGTLDERYRLRVLRAASADVLVVGTSALPEPVLAATGGVGEALEGRRIRLTGRIAEAPSALADGLGLMLDDGSGPVRVIVGADALGGTTFATGDVVIATGPLGQRDSSGTGLAGYRLHATLAGELVAAVPPTPAPTPGPSATPTPAPTPAPSVTLEPPAPSPSLNPSPSPSPSALTVAEARLIASGQPVVTRGTVIAEAGLLGTPALFAIADSTGGIVVHLADGQVAPPRGTLVETRGAIAAPYGQTEVRLGSTGLSIIGAGTLPGAVPIDAGAAGEGTEGRLVSTTGTITVSASKATSGDLAFTITGADGATLRIMADRSAGLDAATLRKGMVGTFTGVSGQRASRKGALDGYRIWLRDRADVVLAPMATESPSSSGPASPALTATPLVTIAAARVREGQKLTVEGILTVDTTLLDASGRRTIVEDATGAIEVYLTAPDSALRLGRRVRITGTVGRAWGAPRLRADEVRVLGERAPMAHALTVAPGAATEWRLVQVRGRIVDLHRSGGRWQAELQVGTTRIPVSGFPGSGIGASSVIEGRTATITGIVKRPYPTATDRRYAIVPRRAGDLVLGPAAAVSASPGTVPGGVSGGRGDTIAGLADGAGPSGTPDIDLADLVAMAGRVVHVGGLVTAVEAGGIRLDDGTAVARIVLAGEAADLLPVLRTGDAVNLTGTVEVGDPPDAETVVVVSDPSAVSLLSDLEAPLDLAALPDAPGNGQEPLVAGFRPGAAVAALASPRDAHPGLGAAPASLAVLGLAALMGGAAALVHRRRARRLFTARIAARLDAIAGPGSGPRDAVGGVGT